MTSQSRNAKRRRRNRANKTGSLLPLLKGVAGRAKFFIDMRGPFQGLPHRPGNNPLCIPCNKPSHTDTEPYEGAYNEMVNGRITYKKVVDCVVCVVCDREFCEDEDCPECARFPARLSCLCRPMLCRECMFSHIHQNKYDCDCGMCGKVFFNCPTCRKPMLV